jgi:hypothetical protein
MFESRESCQAKTLEARVVDWRAIEALSGALENEYKARATYRKVIKRFGSMRPFVNIVEAEDRHVAALLSHFNRLGEVSPPDMWQARVSVPDTLPLGCAEAVRREIENEAMYSRRRGQLTDAQAHLVIRRLEQALRSQYLPAFWRCLEREAGWHGRGMALAGDGCGAPPLPPEQQPADYWFGRFSSGNR